MLDDVTHFSMVGFPLDARNPTELNRSAGEQLQKANRLGIVSCTPAPGGGTRTVCVVRDRSGAELWYGLDKADGGAASMVTLNPAFNGHGRATLVVDGEVSDPEWKPFEIRVGAKFTGEIAAPIVFDLSDPSQIASFAPGAKVAVALSGFGYKPELFPNESAYFAAQRKAGLEYPLAANVFIPSGTMFESVGGALPDGASRPTAHADLAGTILQADLKSNGTGGGRFWALTTRTFNDVTLDLVIDPAQIDKAPKPGQIIYGRFWLTGRIVSAD